MPGEQVGAGPGRGHRLRPGGVRAHIRTALLLGHGHPGQQACLALRRAQPGIVLPGGEQRPEPEGQVGGMAQRRDGRVGHRDRAAMPRLGLRPYEEPGGPGDVHAGGGIGPRRGVQPVADRGAQQDVPGRVELDLVDPVAPRVMGPEHRRVLVGQPGVLLGLPGAGQFTELVQAVPGPPRAFPGGCGQQRRIVRDVVASQRRDLVEHIVGEVRPGGGFPTGDRPRGDRPRGDRQRRHDGDTTVLATPRKPVAMPALYRTDT